MTTQNPTIKPASSISAFANLIKAHGNGDMKKATGEFVINVSDIHYTPEWNLRPINEEHVDEIAIAIENGETVDPFELEPILVDGMPKFKIVDGHHTYNAIQKLVTKNAHSGDHQASVFKGNEADKVVRAFTSSLGQPLTPYQTAKAFQRLKDEGLSNSDIHKRTGKSLSYISNTLFLLNADDTMRDLIEGEKISPSRAGRLMREHGELASAVALVEVGATHEATDTNRGNSERQVSTPTTESANDERINTESTDAQTTRKAAKGATKLRSLSAGKVDAMQELILSLSSRTENGVIELNQIQLTQLEELANSISTIRDHNKQVAETMRQIQE